MLKNLCTMKVRNWLSITITISNNYPKFYSNVGFARSGEASNNQNISQKVVIATVYCKYNS